MYGAASPCRTDEGIWLVTFIDYDLGYIDLEQRTLQTLDNPFGPRLSLCIGTFCCHVSRSDRFILGGGST